MDIKSKCFKVLDAWACAVKAEDDDMIVIAIKGPFDTEAAAQAYGASDECKMEVTAEILKAAASKAFSEVQAEESAKEAIAKAARPAGETLQ